MRGGGAVALAGLAQGGFALTALTPRGRWLRSFGTRGVVRVALGPNGERLGVVAGRGARVTVLDTPDGIRLELRRYLASGAPDSGFGQGGVASVPLEAPNAGHAGLASVTSGAVVIAGATTIAGPASLATVRVTSWGAIDTRYGEGGVARVLPSAWNALSAMVFDGRGVDVLGRAFRPGAEHGFVIALDGSGARRRSFASGGTLRLSHAAGRRAWTLGIDGRRRLLVAGNPVRTQKGYVCRFSPEGLAGSLIRPRRLPHDTDGTLADSDRRAGYDSSDPPGWRHRHEHPAESRRPRCTAPVKRAQESAAIGRRTGTRSRR